MTRRADTTFNTSLFGTRRQQVKHPGGRALPHGKPKLKMIPVGSGEAKPLLLTMPARLLHDPKHLRPTGNVIFF